MLAPAAAVSLTCSYCDFEEVESISQLLLDKLSLASALRHPAQNSETKTIAIKNKMLSSLELDNVNAKDNYSYALIQGKLTTFVYQSKSTWSTASSILSKDTPEETLTKRTAWLSQTHFTQDEGYELARLIIRLLDKSNVYHCDKKDCTSAQCEFRLDVCPNPGCGMQYSRKWANKHSTACPHKVVPCDRCCGENVKRLQMAEHLSEHCGLRTVRCPLYDLGCKTGKDIEF